MTPRRRGDVLICSRGPNGHELVDALTGKHIASGFQDFAEAVTVARERNPRSIWHQIVDDRGRPMGSLLRLPDVPR